MADSVLFLVMPQYPWTGRGRKAFWRSAGNVRALGSPLAALPGTDESLSSPQQQQQQQNVLSVCGLGVWKPLLFYIHPIWASPEALGFFRRIPRDDCWAHDNSAHHGDARQCHSC